MAFRARLRPGSPFTRTFLTASRDHGPSTSAGSAGLDERSRAIVARRWLIEDGEHAATLHELAAEYGVSAERIRQIEVRAMQEMRAAGSAA